MPNQCDAHSHACPLRWTLTILSCSVALACGPKPPANAETAADETTDGNAEVGDGDGDGSDGVDESSTDATDSTEDSDTDTAEDGCSFEEMPVGGFVPWSDLGYYDCDPFAQDCPPGEKCVPFAGDGGNWWENQCVPVMGSLGTGESCTSGPFDEGTDDCDATNWCWLGECTPFCGGTELRPICDRGLNCMITNQGSTTLCLPGCDPLLQNCDDGLACYWASNGFQCAIPGGLTEGDACGWINDCAPGLFCAPGELVPGCTDVACCAAFCDLDCPVCATVGTQCAPLPVEMTPEPRDADVGICTTEGMG